jgi:1-acyl-sn-glycerol-3-phosphate acyltransferase
MIFQDNSFTQIQLEGALDNYFTIEYVVLPTKTLLFLAWFLCSSSTILLAQLIGRPLFFIEKDYYDSYIAWTKELLVVGRIAMTNFWCSVPIRVSSDESVEGELQLTGDGKLRTNFAERMILMANHQSSLDGSYVWWTAYTNHLHGHIIAIVKETLGCIPLLGQVMKICGFIFLARNLRIDRPRLETGLMEQRQEKHGNAKPMWFIIFPEGTVPTPDSRHASNVYAAREGLKPLKYVLLPRSTGIFISLRQLKLDGKVEWLYDCTLAYEGLPYAKTNSHVNILKYADLVQGLLFFRDYVLECRPYV